MTEQALDRKPIDMKALRDQLRQSLQSFAGSGGFLPLQERGSSTAHGRGHWKPQKSSRAPRLLLILVTGVLTTFFSYGQGAVNFVNYFSAANRPPPPLTAPVWGLGIGSGFYLAGDYVAACFAGPVGTSGADIVTYGSLGVVRSWGTGMFAGQDNGGDVLQPFRTGTGAGYWSPCKVTFPGLDIASYANIQVRVWRVAMGPDWRSAWAAWLAHPRDTNYLLGVSSVIDFQLVDPNYHSPLPDQPFPNLFQGTPPLSSFAAVMFAGDPAITQSPTNLTVAEGSSAAFSAAVQLADGCQWYCDDRIVTNGEPISGATSTNLFIASVRPADAGFYWLVATNCFGRSVTSAPPALLTVRPAWGVAQIAVSPANTNFGPVLLGSYAEASLVVTNQGSMMLSNGAATVGAPFSIILGGTFNLPGYGSTNVVVRFTPGSAGGFSNNVVFTTANAGGSTNGVAGTATPALTLGQALNAPLWSWTTGGDASWIPQTNVTHDGASAAQSGLISNSQISWLQSSVTGPGILTFWWKVSSELGFDYLEFYVNGSEQAYISGAENWQQRSFPLGSGTNRLRWRYTKDDSDVYATGQDRGWVDEVSFMCADDPTITQSPTNLTVAEGSSAAFSAVVQHADGCQWYCDDRIVTDGGTISGATSTNLFIASVRLADAGFYRLVATNCFGRSVTSAPPAQLTVVPAWGVALRPSEVRFHAAGGTTNITVTARADYAWSVVNGIPWIGVLSGSNGLGNGILSLTAGANPTPSRRSGTIGVGDFAELAYGDGGSQFLGFETTLGEGMALRFTPTAYPFYLESISVYLAYFPGATPNVDPTAGLGLRVLAEGQAGPGDVIADGIEIRAPSIATNGGVWAEANLDDRSIVVTNGDFYAEAVWIVSGSPTVGLDNSPPGEGRTWVYESGRWALLPLLYPDHPDLQLMVRARGTAGTPPQKLVVTQEMAPSFTLQRHSDAIDLTLHGESGRPYWMLSSTNLVTWTTNWALTPVEGWIQTNLPMTDSKLFYRAMSQ